MDKMIDILNGWLMTAVSGGVFELKQVLLFISTFSLLALFSWKARSIFKLFHDVRNSKINEYQRLLNSYELPEADRECITSEINRIIRYRNSGISDVARQKIVWLLLANHKDIIPIDFFKKFRSFLEIKNSTLVFKKDAFFWVENGFYVFYSLQFLLFSISCIILSVYRGFQITIWQHLMLYTLTIIMFLLSIAFGKMIIRKKECELLNEILNTQHDISE